MIYSLPGSTLLEPIQDKFWNSFCAYGYSLISVIFINYNITVWLQRYLQICLGGTFFKEIFGSVTYRKKGWEPLT